MRSVILAILLLLAGSSALANPNVNQQLRAEQLRLEKIQAQQRIQRLQNARDAQLLRDAQRIQAIRDAQRIQALRDVERIQRFNARPSVRVFRFLFGR